jgi:hypothetical protein
MKTMLRKIFRTKKDAVGHYNTHNKERHVHEGVILGSKGPEELGI